MSCQLMCKGTPSVMGLGTHDKTNTLLLVVSLVTMLRLLCRAGPCITSLNRFKEIADIYRKEQGIKCPYKSSGRRFSEVLDELGGL